MDLGFDGIGDTGDEPFELGQTGFGVEAGLGLFILDVTGFFDSYTQQPSGDVNVGYGVQVRRPVRGLLADRLLRSGHRQRRRSSIRTPTSAEVDAGYVLLDGNYATKFGVGIEHDGAAANALISGLNINAGYEMWEEDYSRTRIFANADYTLSVSIVTLTPYVGYESDIDSDVGSNDFTEIRAGTGLTTQALDIFLKPSLQAAVNYRTATYTDARDFVATELQWSVGLTFEEFLLPYSALSARVGSWTGTNMNTTLNTLGQGISAGRTVRDIDRGDATETLFGYEVTWNYYDLTLRVRLVHDTTARRPRPSRSTTPSPSELASEARYDSARPVESTGRALLPVSALSLGRRDHPTGRSPAARRPESHLVALRRRQRLALRVGRHGRRPRQRDAARGEAVHARVPQVGAAHDLRQDAEGPQPTEVARHHDVQDAVVAAGIGREEEAPAGPGPVLHRDQQRRSVEDGGVRRPVVDLDADPRQPEVAHRRDDAVEVATEAAERVRRGRDPPGDVGVEAGAEGVDERLAVRRADVDPPGPARQERRDGGGSVVPA
jgi:hypothetical protein